MTVAASVTPYGAWKSSLGAMDIAKGSLRLGQIAYSGDRLYWLEGRAQEGGRVTLVVRDSEGVVSDLVPPPYSARSLVHEYGGGAVLVDGEDIFFTNYSDQRIYRAAPGKEPVPVSSPSNCRYADLALDRKRNRLIAVCEDHSGGGKEPENKLVSISLDGDESGSAPENLVTGADFFGFPRLSKDGQLLSWISWNHPNMPWDGSFLHVARLGEQPNELTDAIRVAGALDESIFQPQWSDDGSLFYVTDRSGFWNLREIANPLSLFSNGRGAAIDEDAVSSPVIEMDAEFGMPFWVFGMSTYAFLNDGRMVTSYCEKGVWKLAVIEKSRGSYALNPVETDFTDFAYLASNGQTVAFLAATPKMVSSLVTFEPSSDSSSGLFKVVRKSSEIELDDADVSIPELIEYPTEDGLTSYAFYYAPTNSRCRPKEGELPPLLVKSHGGPTGSTSSGGLRLDIQYWTSRGFAVVDVNYGGSTGYGTAYRRRLDRAWGVVDVKDCENAALYLVREGLVDRERLAITGGSAGGYTTLCALTFGDVFKAGASHYGIGDLEALALETHKFESRYGDRLVGDYPEEKQLYFDRSPINFTDQLSCPVIFFQGLEDKVVPPNQAEAMVDSLKSKGVPVAYIAYEGEQHGFRKAENIQRTIESELFFYSRVFGFEPSDDLEPVPIENL